MRTHAFYLRPLSRLLIASTIAATFPAHAGDKEDIERLIAQNQELDAKIEQLRAQNKELDEKIRNLARKQEIDKEESKAAKFVEKHEKDGSVKPSGLGWVSADGRNEINLTGRVHFDSRIVSAGSFGDSLDRDAGAMADRFTVRRARFGVSGIFNKDIGYEVQLNGVGNSANLVDTAFANYKLKPELQLRLGRFNQPFALETQTSANNIDFMERSYVHQLAPFKQLGAMLHGESGMFTYAASGYQRDFDPQNNYTGLGPEVAARVTANIAKAFSQSDQFIFHVGAAGTTGRQTITPTTSSQNGSGIETRGVVLAFNDENGGLNNVYRNRIYGAPPCGTNTAGPTLVNGSYTCASATGPNLPSSEVAKISRSMAGLELAVASGPAKFQAESVQTHLSAGANANNSSDGNPYTTNMSGTAKANYAEFIYNLTGEDWSDAYKAGVFTGIKPNSPYNFTTGSGLGGWQLAVRYSTFDASDFGTVATGSTCPSGGGVSCSAVDGSIYGASSSGKQYQLQGSPKGNTVTLGLNWLLNPNARILFNYSQSNFDQSFLPVDIGTKTSLSKAGSKVDVVSVRTQFNF